MPQATTKRPSAAYQPGAGPITVERLSRGLATRAQLTVILKSLTGMVPVEHLLAINAPSDSGTSTLLSLLTGSDQTTGGRVVCAGIIGQHGTSAIVLPAGEVRA
jgi:predicted ABC-type transport system involved in lysophospholipase L1 biosynthesis ATPase subunit